MTWWNIAAREEGKYRAIGGHKLSPSMKMDKSGHYLCHICGRAINYQETRHLPERKNRNGR